ncbi:acetate/propionate family kinase [Sinirhodobacter huangdaonensis]|uniref:Acetate kinase n=1 Tax=Paenirhodobacter huangdaonensis TaxID=2501515 RepID=A0A443LLA6_9RHOB|nr:acetate/propionate family kinase [Sinirhodobacter huangdaonensis]RWR49981.1 acetate/propionate family kinase [Sinirhodobacter huangdaonensis]
MTTRAILTVNSGSSSLKLGLFTEELETLAMCHVDRIGRREAAMKIRDAAGRNLPMPDHAPTAFRTNGAALRTALEVFQTDFPGLEVIAVGHRVVHGGVNHAEPLRLTEATMKELARLAPFAPLHQPHNLAGVRAAVDTFPGVPNIACFDTAFHREHPFVNDTYALPRRYYEKGVRRYGFHGLSYDYITGELARTEPDLHEGRVVVAHLGSGASMCGMKGGHPIDTTMGFSALDGLPMGTRTGQIDPGVLLYLMDTDGLDSHGLSELLYKESGLQGLSGVSNDMRTLESSDDPHAQEAIDYFCFRIRRELGGITAALGGIDGLIFCGGIGENSANVRAQVCEGMEWLGITLDAEKNVTHAREISTGKTRVLVIPTNEEIVIARAAAQVLKTL